MIKPMQRPGEAEREGDDQIAGGRDESRERQGGARAELGGEPVGGHLQAAHGPAIERPDERQPGVGQTELRLPDRQKRIELIGVAVMQEMGEAGAREVAALRLPAPRFWSFGAQSAVAVLCIAELRLLARPTLYP